MKKNCVKCKATIEYETAYCPFCGSLQPGSDTFVKEKAGNMQIKKPGQKMRVPVSVNKNTETEKKEGLPDKKTFKKNIKKEEVKELEYKAYHDQLTGVKNRQAFEEDIKKVSQKEAAIVSVDANGLKETNDTFGHKYGDLLLQIIADSLTDAFGECVYRIGGDEFIVLEEGIRENVLQTKISQFHNQLISKKDELEDIHEDFPVGAAAGYACGDGEKTIRDILDEADRRMYEDKKKSKVENEKRTDDENELQSNQEIENETVQEKYNANYDGYYDDVEPVIEKEEKEFSKELIVKAGTAIVATIIFIVVFELLI